MTDVDPTEAEAILGELFEEEIEHGDGSFFVHVGLPRSAKWSEFRNHYDGDGVADCDRAAADILSYPPIGERLAKLEVGREGGHHNDGDVPTSS